MTSKTHTYTAKKNGTRSPENTIAGEGSREAGQDEEAAGPQRQRPEEGRTEGARACVCAMQGNCKPVRNIITKFILIFVHPTQSQMPDPKTYKQHFENKHPKNDMPEELKDL